MTFVEFPTPPGTNGLTVVGYGIIVSTGPIWVTYWGNPVSVPLGRFTSEAEVMEALRQLGFDARVAQPRQSNQLNLLAAAVFQDRMPVFDNSEHARHYPEEWAEVRRLVLPRRRGGVTNVNTGNVANLLQAGHIGSYNENPQPPRQEKFW